ncbi:phosphoadenylyl-sulfate reductase [Tepidimonas sp. HKU79]|jgi:phosphoadenosine phosphosulfate reductase|uniref:phosphoadenylyl-sulfate reductase n=1 Tax=unclassified Tepidimonas TaxID=2631705 RepID=UPI002613C197|nr:phosphoadenylyl-sulfate reductase [uncultured Tepidimonas sp.]
MAERRIPEIVIEPPLPGRAISLYARARAEYPALVEATVQRLREAAADHPGRIVQATSLGAEDMVLTDLIARHGIAIDVAMIDTGRLHPETLALRARAEAHWGIRIAVFGPEPAKVADFERQHGPWPMYDSVALRHTCCGLRKVEPLQRLLAGRSAWVTGLRRAQSAHRADVPLRAPDEAGRVKYNPLADWQWADVWHHIATHGVPYNPLHDAFMPSIGCAPCTRPIAVGEDFRAGRWWWEDDTRRECGLHVPTANTPSRSTSLSPIQP